MTAASKNTNTIALLTLAQLNEDDGMNVLTSMQNSSVAGAALAVALKRKQAKNKEEAVEKAADAVIKLVEHADASVNNYRAHYRQLRASMRNVKEKMTNIAVARMYGEETMNFLPLQVLLTGVEGVDEQHKGLLEVPPAKREEYLKKLKTREDV